MSRARRLLTAVVFGLGLSPALGHAQLAIDDAGYPISVLYFPQRLVNGHTYEIRTDTTLTPTPQFPDPDAVLSLILKRGASTVTVAGATTCGSSSRPACFTYSVPNDGQTYQQLLLRARTTLSAGQTSIYYRDLTVVGSGGPWTRLGSSPFTFGGGVHKTNAGTTSRLFLHTTFRPGRNDHHVIYTTKDGADAWNVVSEHAANGRVGNTAMVYAAPDTQRCATCNNCSGCCIQCETLDPLRYQGTKQHVFGTPLSSKVGPMRLVQNNWYLGPSADWDGDGLGLVLELALGTCDTYTQANPLGNGMKCAQFVGCEPADLHNPWGPRKNDALCKARLRDTDHDGLRDDLEVFGYDDLRMYLPLYGSDPAHMDVFVELDSYDQDTTDAACDGFETVNPLGAISDEQDADFFAITTGAYARAPAMLNPDGKSGIRIHYDVGIANPDLTDTRWGAWGGGNTCLPLVVPKAERCRPDLRGGTLCGFSPIRTGVFAYGVDWAQQYDNWLLNRTPLGDVSYVANFASAHAHELGHIARLNHGGPEGTAAASANYREGYLSIMNYHYSAGIQTHPELDYSFSSGTWLPLSIREPQELCPFGGLADLSAFSVLRDYPTCRTGIDPGCLGGSYGCWNVDWNKDGGYAGATYVQHASLNRRTSTAEPPHRSTSAPSITIAGDVLAVTYTRIDHTDNNHLILKADSNKDCVAYPNFGVPADQAYPSCFQLGAELDLGPVAASSIEGTRLSVNGLTGEALLFMFNHFGHLMWAKLAVGPSSDNRLELIMRAAEGAYNLYDTSGQIATISLAQGSTEPDLVRMPGSDDVLLVYRDPAGAYWQAFYAPMTNSWSFPAAVRDLDGAALPLVTSVSMAEVNDSIYLAGTTAGGTVQVYKYASIGRWSPMTDPSPAIVASTVFPPPTLRDAGARRRNRASPAAPDPASGNTSAFRAARDSSFFVGAVGQRRELAPGLHGSCRGRMGCAHGARRQSSCRSAARCSFE